MSEPLYILFGLVLAGYFGTAGYDYGTGVLLRATAKTDHERRRVLAALGPFFLGNEVWLVAALGLLLGAFPLADGPLLTGLYPVAVPLIAAIAVFTAAVQLRSRAAAARPVWDLLIVAGATVVAAGWGAVLGLVLQGFPARPGPLPFLTGALGVLLFVQHGAALLALRTPEPIRGRAERIASRITWPAVALTGAAALAAALTGDAIGQPVPAVAGAVGLVVVLLVTGRLRRAGRRGWTLVGTGLAAVAPLLITGLAMSPYLYVHTGAGESLTAGQAVAGSGTTGFLFAAAVPVLPVLVGFQAATWWAWRRAPRGIGFY